MDGMLGGFRRGELLALEWKHVDFENDTITIEQSIPEFDGDKPSLRLRKQKVPNGSLSCRHGT